MAFAWSVSRLNTYIQCPYLYYLRYKKRLKVPKAWYLIFGAAIHRAIEVCHKGQPNQNFIPTPKRPLYFRSAKSFGGFWLGFWEREIARAERETGISWESESQPERLKGFGWALLAGTKDGRYKGYYECITHPPFPVEVLEVELSLEGTLWGYPFTGIIDQIWKTRKGVAIVDITTGRSQAVKFRQFTAYDELLSAYCRANPLAQERFGGERQYFIWNMQTEKLIPTKPQDPATLRESLAVASAGVQDGLFQEAQQDTDCRFCEYREVCGKTVGKPISAMRAGNELGVEIITPDRPPKPKPRQLTFKAGVGVEGGWFRGDQVTGK